MYHADMISDEGKISDSHLLVDETSCISSNEDRASHVGREKSRESLLMYSVTLIIVNASIPYNSLSALHFSIQDILFVSDGSRYGAVRNIIEADYFDSVTSLSEEMI